jgi:chromosome segregation ATPase
MARNTSPTWEKTEKTFAQTWMEIGAKIWQNWLTWIGVNTKSKQNSDFTVNEDRQIIAVPTPDEIASQEAQMRSQIAEKERSLQQQLAAKASLANELQQLASEKEKSDRAYLQQLEIKDWTIRDLQNRLTLQSQLNEKHAANEGTLQQKLDRQERLIAELQQKINDLQSAASIGSWQLNKWRSRTFFN